MAGMRTVYICLRTTEFPKKSRPLLRSRQRASAVPTCEVAVSEARDGRDAAHEPWRRAADEMARRGT